jgi:hypothetical protein
VYLQIRTQTLFYIYRKIFTDNGKSLFKRSKLLPDLSRPPCNLKFSFNGFRTFSEYNSTKKNFVTVKTCAYFHLTLVPYLSCSPIKLSCLDLNPYRNPNFSVLRIRDVYPGSGSDPFLVSRIRIRPSFIPYPDPTNKRREKLN